MRKLLLVLFLPFLFSVLRVTIKNPNSYDLVNYQVRIDLSSFNLDPYLKACEDVYCTKVLDFCYEQTNGECNTTFSKVIWVKVNLTANSTKDIYIFDSQVEDYSKRGEEVFDFYDDFEVWQGWVIYDSDKDGAGAVTQDCSTFGFCVLKKYGDYDPDGGYKNISKILNYPFILEARIRRDTTTYGSVDRIGVLNSGWDGYGFAVQHWQTPDVISIDYRVDCGDDLSCSRTTVDLGSLPTDIGYGNWYRVSFSWNKGNMRILVYRDDGTLLGNFSHYNSSYSNFTYVYVYGGSSYYVDWIRIRKFADMEPEITMYASSIVIEVYSPESKIYADFNTSVTLPIRFRVYGSYSEYNVSVVVDGTTIYENSSYKNDTAAEINHTFTEGEHIVKIIANASLDSKSKTVWLKFISCAKSPSWWNTSWKYRYPICIVEQENNTLTDFQVKLNISYNPKMKSDYSDLRFTFYNETSGEEIEIPYYIENYTDSYAIIWVKVPKIPALDSSTIYAYYGNSEAVSESNSKAVFDFFDDFDDGILDWNVTYIEGTPIVLEKDGYLIIGDDTDTYWETAFVWRNIPIYDRFCIDINFSAVYVNNPLYDHYAGIGLSSNLEVVSRGYVREASGGSVLDRRLSIYNGVIVYDKSLQWEDSKFYTLTFCKIDGKLIVVLKDTVGEAEYSENYSYFGIIANGGEACIVNWSFDWIRLRKYGVYTYLEGEEEVAPDVTPPTTTANPTEAVSLTNITVTLYCSDDLSGCNKTYYLITSQSSCPATGYSEYTGPISIYQVGTWYICAYSVDNAGNTESPKLFGPYRIYESSDILNLSGLAIIVTKDDLVNFTAIFYKRAKNNFGVIFGYNGSSSYIYFFNNSKVYLAKCNETFFCIILSSKDYSLRESSIMKLVCKTGYSAIFDENYKVIETNFCEEGKIGFVCKDCFLGAIGIKFY